MLRYIESSYRLHNLDMMTNVFLLSKQLVNVPQYAFYFAQFDLCMSHYVLTLNNLARAD